MAEQQWHWTEAGQPAGPGTAAELAQRVAAGRVGPDEQAWAEGMANWTAVRTLPEFARHLPRRAALTPQQLSTPAAMPAADAASGQLGYYSTSGALPPRAADVLRGHARPTGDVGDWPLDDARFGQLVDTMKARKPIVAAAGLFRALFALYLILLIILLIAGLGMLSASRGSVRAEAIGMLTAAAVIGGIASLCLFTARATARSQRWAPITMLVLFGLGFAASVVGIVFGSMQRNAAPAVGTNFVGLLFAGAFAATAARAVSAIPKYRRQPAWCQEVLARVERKK